MSPRQPCGTNSPPVSLLGSGRNGTNDLSSITPPGDDNQPVWVHAGMFSAMQHEYERSNHRRFMVKEVRTFDEMNQPIKGRKAP
jgi:hypothetical protein